MKLERRLISFREDYSQLLAMQLESYAINFPGQEMMESWFHTSLEAASIFKRVWIYLSGNEIVGWLWLDWDEPEVLHICHVQVKSTYWGNGIGRELVKDAMQIARDKGKTAITLNVTKSNERAMALYANLGFTVGQDNGDRQLMRYELAQEKIIKGGWLRKLI
ncbi:MAG: GNAT family N-acetyltransferase [Chloroflexi bacterium]|nr:GNAT family N-acetyltransferase [Chloroflexota bacterium]